MRMTIEARIEDSTGSEPIRLADRVAASSFNCSHMR
jgi:hypothetical protein